MGLGGGETEVNKKIRSLPQFVQPLAGHQIGPEGAPGNISSRGLHPEGAVMDRHRKLSSLANSDQEEGTEKLMWHPRRRHPCG